MLLNLNPTMNLNLNDPKLIATVTAKKRALVDTLKQACESLAPIVFANSLGAEDMVLTDIILKGRFPIEIFSLDTGRLPSETYDLIAEVDRYYGEKIKLYYPNFAALEAYAREHGINGFYDSVAARQACCRVRKLEPLRRALAGKQAWVTGLRAAQAVTRTQLPMRAWDADNGLEKLNPLADWSEREVWAFIRYYQVPYNRLHDRAYPSIGCAPCTRAVTVGEDLRAGRWWWESPETKECGLHRKHLTDSHPALAARQ